MTDFEILCERGLEAAQDMDKGRWIIGDLALEVKKNYGRDTVGKFATRINVPKARVQEYRGMSAFYPENLRRQIFEQYPEGLITYTHLRQAKRLKDPAAVIAFIEECGANGYTCDEAALKMTERLGKPVTPPKLLEGLAYIVDIHGQYVTLRIDTSLNTAVWEAKNKQLPVEMVIRPSEEHPDFGAETARFGSGWERRIDTRLVTKESVPA